MLGLAEALEAGRVELPIDRTQLWGWVPLELVEGVLPELQALSEGGMQLAHIAYMLRLLAEERATTQAATDRVQLVWSGKEVLADKSRDTAIVVQELFRQARESVLIVSYALDTGSKAETIFGPLAARMDAEPSLQVRLFVNVHRRDQDKTDEAILLQEFADNFRTKIWPGKRLPKVFHDPRCLEIDAKKRACLHAKCIVIDTDQALITSANFTEAAHESNIEAGTLISDPILVRALKAQFDTLVDHGELELVPGIRGDSLSP
jgi:phosphatidylserine/phosphatidylglycerophosphate/cardiolipin synthase-like enzyme